MYYLENGLEILQIDHVSLGTRDIGRRMTASNNTNRLTKLSGGLKNLK